MEMMTRLRALRRVIGARRRLRFFNHGLGINLHFVPLDPGQGWGGPIGRSAMQRPTLCGTYLSGPGEGTTQPDIVSCWQCALEIERDPRRWDPPVVRRAHTDRGMTWCSTCGGVDGSPPGCKCKSEAPAPTAPQGTAEPGRCAGAMSQDTEQTPQLGKLHHPQGRHAVCRARRFPSAAARGGHRLSRLRHGFWASRRDRARGSWGAAPAPALSPVGRHHRDRSTRQAMEGQAIQPAASQGPESGHVDCSARGHRDPRDTRSTWRAALGRFAS